MIGEKEARALREERVRWLRSLTPRRSLELYLALWEEFGPRERGVAQYVLLVRRAFDRASRSEGGRRP